MGKSTISMAIFNSYFDIPRGYRSRMIPIISGSPSPSQHFFTPHHGEGPTNGATLEGGWASAVAAPWKNSSEYIGSDEDTESV